MLEFVVCGECPTDLNGENSPLKRAADSLLERWYSEKSKMHFISRSDLSDSSKNARPKRGAVVRGKKSFSPEFRSVFAFSKCLAQKAKNMGKNCGAIYFKDMDFSSSVNRDVYFKNLISSMHKGFDEVEFKNGVPMVPKTRSESWILCALDPDAGQKSYYENLPGSDNSPKSGKKVLAKFLHCSVKENYDKVRAKLSAFDWSELSAPSFVFFKNRFHVVSAAMLHEKFPDGLNPENTRVPSN